MKKYVIIFVLQFMAWLSIAQIPEEGELLQIHSINNLSDTITISNPIEGSLVYVSNTKSTYQKYNTGWRLWYQSELVSIDSLQTIIDSYGDSTNCCLEYQYVDCGSAITCIGDTLNCGIVVDINATNDTATIVAVDEYDFISEINYYSTGDVDLLTTNVVELSNIDLFNNPYDQNTYFNLLAINEIFACVSARIATNYKSEGCPNQQWMFPTIDMALALEESLPTINPILHIMNKEKIYIGDEYWLMNVIENDIFYGYFIQIGGTGANGPIKRDFHNSRKKVRPMSIVPL